MALTQTAPSLSARGPAPGLRSAAFRALGTRCEVQYSCDNDEQAEAFAVAARGWVERFEARCTRFRTDSIIGRINASAGDGWWHELDEEMERFLDVCETLHAWTGGVLDATAGPLERVWDYRANPPRVPSDAEVAAAKRLVGWPRVERRPGAVRLPEAGMELDFGGWGKEYAVDRVGQMARDHGLTAALVDFGHDIYAVGAPPGRPAWHVGLEDPGRPGQFAGSVAVVDGGVAGSGDYLRGYTIAGRRYGHIIDPRSGRPVDNGNRQVTVLAGSCLQAGVLATTAFILGAVEGIRLVEETMGAEARIVTDDAVYQSRGFFHHVVA